MNWIVNWIMYWWVRLHTIPVGVKIKYEMSSINLIVLCVYAC